MQSVIPAERRVSLPMYHTRRAIPLQMEHLREPILLYQHRRSTRLCDFTTARRVFTQTERVQRFVEDEAG